jgi:hypothetical protein
LHLIVQTILGDQVIPPVLVHKQVLLLVASFQQALARSGDLVRGERITEHPFR